jgi:hypothetical protein
MKFKPCASGCHSTTIAAVSLTQPQHSTSNNDLTSPPRDPSARAIRVSCARRLIMNQSQDQKAGPSEVPAAGPVHGRWRRLIKLTCLCLAVLSACATLYHLLLRDGRPAWVWRPLGGYDGYDGVQKAESPSRSRYLLGVGKADITGSPCRHPLVGLSADI